MLQDERPLPATWAQGRRMTMKHRRIVSTFPESHALQLQLCKKAVLMWKY